MSVVLQVMLCMFVQLLKTLRTVTHATEKQDRQGEERKGKSTGALMLLKALTVRSII